MRFYIRSFYTILTHKHFSDAFRRCSSYHDFTQIGGSSESVDLPKSPSDDEGLSQKHRHVSRTLSEPSKLSGGRMGRSHSEQRERRSIHQRNSRLSSRLCVCEWHIQVVFLKAETITAKAALCCFCYIHKQNTEPRFKQKKSLWSKQGGGFSPGSNRTVTNRCYGNRFFDLQRSAGIKTTHTDGKGWHTTPWWLDHAATYSLLCTCLTESGVQIQSQHSRLRKVAKSKQGWNFQKKILIFNCFMRVNLYKT